MRESIEILWKAMELERAQGRQSEMQRSTATGFVITISLALIGLYSSDKIYIARYLLGGIIAALGLFGSVLVAKYYERWRLHGDRARCFRERIASLCPDAQLLEISNASDESHKRVYRVLYRLRLNQLWVLINMIVMALGVIIALWMR